MRNDLMELKSVSIGYGKTICKAINAKIQSGELIGLAGKNGSGKSTLLRSILGIQSLLSGEILFQNQNLEFLNYRERANLISVVFSRLNDVPPIQVQELLTLGRLPHKNWVEKLTRQERMLIQKAMEQVGIFHLKNKLATELSDGQLQMVMIARALVQDTPLVLMDEPTSHLDIENQFRIFELIDQLSKETNKTFIVASHQVELLLQNSTQIWWVDNGEFHAGFPEQIAYEQKILEKLSQKKIRFDYQSGKFQFDYFKTRKINLKSDSSDLAYWVKHALERNGFEISEGSEDLGLKIRIKNLILYLNDKTFESIDELIKFLNHEI